MDATDYYEKAKRIYQLWKKENRSDIEKELESVNKYGFAQLMHHYVQKMGERYTNTDDKKKISGEQIEFMLTAHPTPFDAPVTPSLQPETISSILKSYDYWPKVGITLFKYFRLDKSVQQ